MIDGRRAHSEGYPPGLAVRKYLRLVPVRSAWKIGIFDRFMAGTRFDVVETEPVMRWFGVMECAGRAERRQRLWWFGNRGSR